MPNTKNNDISALRDALFDALRAVQAGTMTPEQAKGVNDIAQTLINSAKVEVEFLKVTGGDGTGFIALEPNLPGLTGRVVHRIGG